VVTAVFPATGVPVNGTCGTAAKNYLSSDTSYGSDTFCSAGTAVPTTPAFPAQGSSTTWTCQGLHSGTNASCTATRNPALSACTTSGGITCTRTTSGLYTIDQCTGAGTRTWTTPVGVTSVEYLVIGGGGGGSNGGNYGGGGGAGQFLTGTGFSVSGNISLKIGAGGGAATYGIVLFLEA
jgi:hypothetical protein